MRNRFMRIVWTINGLLMLVVLVVALIFIGYLIKEEVFYKPFQEQTVIVGSKIDEAKQDSVILQGVELGEISEIGGSRVYIMPINVRTFEEPVKAKAFDYSSSLSLDHSGSTINYLFLDQNMIPTHTLLREKAFVGECRYPDMYDEPDSIMQNIFYQIALRDSDKDGTISSSDDSDLYLTDLYGKNLTKITNNIDVSSYRLINRNEVLIRFNRREDREKEYAREHIAKYSIAEKRFAAITQFQDEVKKLEGILNK
jgi:hypothetical protein